MHSHGPALSEAAPLALVDGQCINLATQRDALDAVSARAGSGRGFTLFTLNMDHLVKRRSNPAFRAAYARATLVTADGAPVVAMARRQDRRVSVTTGADLVEPLCKAAAEDGLSVYLFGATRSSLEKAARSLRERHRGLSIVGLEAPPFGFDPQSPAADAAAARIAASGARLVLVALGAPKQELFADRAFSRHPQLGFVCIGAALDFISGEQVRAPRILHGTGLEWLWRLAAQPRRLAWRYWLCARLLGELALAGPARRGVTPAAR